MDKDKDFLFLGPQFPQQITGGCELEMGLDNPAVLPISGCMTQGCCWWGLLCRVWEWQCWGQGLSRRDLWGRVVSAQGLSQSGCACLLESGVQLPACGARGCWRAHTCCSPAQRCVSLCEGTSRLAWVCTRRSVGLSGLGGAGSAWAWAPP